MVIINKQSQTTANLSTKQHCIRCIQESAMNCSMIHSACSVVLLSQVFSTYVTLNLTQTIHILSSIYIAYSHISIVNYNKATEMCLVQWGAELYC